MFKGHVADIPNVLPTRRGSVISARSQVAKHGEKNGRGFEFRRRLGRKAYVIANGVLLRGVQLGEGMLKTFGRLILQPSQAADHDFPMPLLFFIGGADPFVNEIHDLQLTGGGRFAIRWQDDIA